MWTSHLNLQLLNIWTFDNGLLHALLMASKLAHCNEENQRI